ncbi:GTPase family protein [Halomicronema hongdechloris]|nr:GTPase [Halomicronema hongdechloris]
MILTRWQWIVLGLPVVGLVSFLGVAAAWQIHAWQLNWIWAVIILLLLGWRWLLVRWTQPARSQIDDLVDQASQKLEEAQQTDTGEIATAVEAALQRVLQVAESDPPIWEDWPRFWQRCQELVSAIAQIYYPEVKYPLLNIYVPQAYGLIRGTVDDLDRWMQQLSPVLNQVTVGQAVQAYELYQRVEPSARWVWRLFNWSQWLWNPAAAAARLASQRYGNQATQQLLANLGTLARQKALQTLCHQAVLLYGGDRSALPQPLLQESPPAEETTQTLRQILQQAEPTEPVEKKPVEILLLGRTGAGKSSLINTLFAADQAEVDVLPSTDKIQRYQWSSQDGHRLILWDTPGYEQIARDDVRQSVMEKAATADLLLLVTPALDPALRMDVDLLQELRHQGHDHPAIAIVTQVDRLRPLREWSPPYDWQWGERAKEVAIREATQYRADALADSCDRVLPLVTYDAQAQRSPWNADALALTLIDTMAPAKQSRLGRFLRQRQARIVAAAKIIERYALQMTTNQGLTALLKSPVLQFLSTLTTGSPALAQVLANRIPVEELPLVIGKLQMAYELFQVVAPDDAHFDLLGLWPLMVDNPAAPDRTATALGHALVAYWSESLVLDQLQTRFRHYLNASPAPSTPSWGETR